MLGNAHQIIRKKKILKGLTFDIRSSIKCFTVRSNEPYNHINTACLRHLLIQTPHCHFMFLRYSSACIIIYCE